MSNALTRAARPLVMPPNDKAVLMALADMARDPADPDAPCECWPPMHGRDGAVGLCDWTCLSERAVQRAVKALQAAGLIRRRQLSHGARYTVTLATSPVQQSGDCQSGEVSPVPQSGDCQTPAPVPQSPKASGSTTSKKKATPSPSTLRRDDYPMPDGVDPAHWSDFLANRKRKRLPNTASAHALLIQELTKHATPDWPWPRLIALAAGKGWASVRNPDREESPHGQRSPQLGGAGASRPFRGRTVDGFAAVLRDVAARGRADDASGG